MSINYKKTVAVFDGHCEIEEAETLLSWFLENPKGKINLKQLSQLHTAVLQVIIVLKPQVSAWPEDKKLSIWLMRLLST